MNPKTALGEQFWTVLVIQEPCKPRSQGHTTPDQPTTSLNMRIANARRLTLKINLLKPQPYWRESWKTPFWRVITSFLELGHVLVDGIKPPASSVTKHSRLFAFRAVPPF
jgi:hypothetical protein